MKALYLDFILKVLDIFWDTFCNSNYLGLCLSDG